MSNPFAPAPQANPFAPAATHIPFAPQPGTFSTPAYGAPAAPPPTDFAQMFSGMGDAEAANEKLPPLPAGDTSS